MPCFLKAKNKKQKFDSWLLPARWNDARYADGCVVCKLGAERVLWHTLNEGGGCSDNVYEYDRLTGP
jgi:hypothetical protein